jgi:hypothetical protein
MFLRYLVVLGEQERWERRITVEGFQTKFFSVQISTFCGQNNVFYDSVRLQTIFSKIRPGQFVGQN